MTNYKGMFLGAATLLTADVAALYEMKMTVGICDSSTRGNEINMWRDESYAFCEEKCLADDTCHSFTLGNGYHMYDGTC